MALGTIAPVPPAVDTSFRSGWCLYKTTMGSSGAERPLWHISRGETWRAVFRLDSVFGPILVLSERRNCVLTGVSSLPGNVAKVGVRLDLLGRDVGTGCRTPWHQS